MTFEELKRRVPDATVDTWHQHANGGGWVENSARVADSAVVIGSATVRDYAVVRDYATVDNRAIVRDCATVRDYAVVCGYATVIGSAVVTAGTWNVPPVQIQGSQWFVGQSAPGTIRAGCEEHTFDKWQRNWDALADKHKLTPELRREYKAYIDIICAIGVPGPGGDE